jgi:hypothetical protein
MGFIEHNRGKSVMTRRGLFRLFGGAAAVPVTAVVGPNITHNPPLWSEWFSRCGHKSETFNILLKQRFGPDIARTIEMHVFDSKGVADKLRKSGDNEA